MSRKILLTVAAVLLSCIMLATVAYADQEGLYTYIELGGEVIITDVDTSISGIVTVPAELGGYPVVGIGNDAFENCSSVTEVVLPEGILSIGKDAFRSCTQMTTISIPYGVTSVGDYAFYGCTVLKDISLPGSVVTIGSHAFAACDSLTDVVIPKGVTAIGSYAFSQCSSLASIVIPEGVKKIENYTFRSCLKLSNVTLPNTVTVINSSAFHSCTALKSITLPNNLTSIGEYAFCNCTALKSITLPNSLTSIGEKAFYSCEALTGVSIPKSVTSIGSYAFHYDRSNSTKYYVLPNLTIYGYNDTYAQTYATKEGIKFYSRGDIAKPSFVTNLSDAAFALGDTATLSVSANSASEGTITYQWYVSSTANGEGTAISGAVEASYTVPTDSESVKYYYVIAVNTNGEYTASAKSAVAKITVGENGTEGDEEESGNAEVPVIFAQTSSSACRVGEEVVLFVSASVSDGGALSYQWYVSDTADEEGTPIEGAVSAGYKPSSETAGTKYYYVVITNTKGEFSTSVKSDVMVLAVGSGYITGDVNSSGQTDSEDSRILKQYFAGYNVEDELTNPDAADINSDGRVARNDAGILARYIDGWREYSVLLPSLSMK